MGWRFARPREYTRGRDRFPDGTENRQDRDPAGVQHLRARGRRSPRGAHAGRGAPDRVRQSAARRALALSLEGRDPGYARGRGADEDTQAGLDCAALAPPRDPSLPDAGVHRGPCGRGGSQVHGVARGRARARGRGVSANAAGGAARLVLGIETSCDDCSVAVLEAGERLRSHLIAAQDVHRLYGGVVPELASRAHLELLPRMVKEALAEAGTGADRLTAIAVTRAPGLVGSLVVGVAFARAYGLALGIPVIGINHVEAHLHAAAVEHGESPLPAVALVVSGGHTELVEVLDLGRYRWLGSTRD